MNRSILNRVDFEQSRQLPVWPISCPGRSEREINRGRPFISHLITKSATSKGDWNGSWLCSLLFTYIHYSVILYPHTKWEKIAAQRKNFLCSGMLVVGFFLSIYSFLMVLDNSKKDTCDSRGNWIAIFILAMQIFCIGE